MSTPSYGLERPHYCTAPRRQSLRDSDVRLASLPRLSPSIMALAAGHREGETGQSMLGKHELNRPSPPYALVHLV